MIRADGNNHYNRHRGIVIRLLNSMSRDDALLTLVRAVVEPHGLDDQAVLQRVLDREGSLSSRVSERIAMPHAVWEGLDETLLGFGVCRAGIDWDGRAEPVQLVVLLIGPEELHLASISSVSRLLQAPGVVDAIVEARDEHTVHALLSGGDRASAPVAARTLTVTAATVHHAAELARSLPENPVVISTSNRAVLNMLGPLAEYPLAERTFILGPGLKSATGVSRDENERSPADGVPPGVSVISTDRFPDERDGPAVLTLLPLLAINVVRAGSEVILLSGRAEHGGLDAVRLVDISRELQIPDGLAEAHLPEGVRLEVVIRTLHLAAELSVQGREGKAIGSIFVIGDDPGLENWTQQMILNPFAGYVATDRNVLDPSLSETVKELAKIDGAFVVAGDGTLMSAGTHLAGRPDPREMDAGLGARHAAALGITAAADVLAICLSESTGTITLFYGGRRLLRR